MLMRQKIPTTPTLSSKDPARMKGADCGGWDSASRQQDKADPGKTATN